VNSGLLDNQGKIINYIDTSILNNLGTLNNSGNLDNFGLFINSATLNNSGLLKNASSIGNTGQMNNSGMFKNDQFGVFNNFNQFENLSTGTLINRGEINNSGVMENAGTIHVTNTGVVQGSTTSVFIQTDGRSIIDGYLSAGIMAFQGGTVEGLGIIDSAYYIDIGAAAVIAPGSTPTTDPIGSLTFTNDLSIFGGLSLEFDSLTDFDMVSIIGDSIFQPGSNIDLIFGFTPEAGDIFTFLFSNSLTGFEDISFTVSGSGSVPFKISELNGNLSASFVPVPAALPLFASALTGLGLFGWRCKKSA